jgi:hypothetical protein
VRRLIGLLAATACLAAANSAAASVTFGADLTTGENGQAVPCSNYSYPDGQPGPACVSTLVPKGPNSHAPAPVDGVITSFSLRMATPVTGRLRLSRLDDNSQPFTSAMTFKGTSADVSAPGDSVTHSFPVRLPVATGDVIGFASSVAISRAVNGNNSRRVDRDGADGTTGTVAIMPASEVANNETPISATIEGDADGDGYGDETQDKCPTLASTHDACPGTVPTTGGGTGGTDGSTSSPPPATPDTFAPVLSPVTINHPTFRIDPSAAAAKAPKGATLSFLTSEAGTARLTVYLLRPGRRSGNRCVAPPPRRSRGRACTKQVTLAAVDKPVVAQRNTIAFPGRVRVGSLVRALAPGRYRVDVQVRDAAGNASNVAGVAFTIVKG